MALPALTLAYFANELGAEYGLLSATHYDMLYQHFMNRALRRRKHSCSCPDERHALLHRGYDAANEECDGTVNAADDDKVALAEQVSLKTTRTLVMQSTLAAIFEFGAAAVVGRLSDLMGRRPVLLASSVALLFTKLCPVVWPSVGAVWVAKSGGEALNTICTDVLLSAVSDMFGSDMQKYGATAGYLRALGGIGWMFGCVLGGYVWVLACVCQLFRHSKLRGHLNHMCSEDCKRPYVALFCVTCSDHNQRAQAFGRLGQPFAATLRSFSCLSGHIGLRRRRNAGDEPV